jgi:hypothetical protein
MSSRITWPFARSFTIVAAVLLFRIGAAAAANSVDDVLQQQRDLLAGRPATVAALFSEQRSAGEDGPPGDAQESARRLLLGVTPGQLHPGVSTASGDRIYGDAQVLARHLLLGNRGALPAGS